MSGENTVSVLVRISIEEHIPSVSEYRAVRRKFGPKSQEVTGGWRKLHNEELHRL
jgi:hypothetical protein